MTNWQWRIIMALVRYVLRKEDFDTPSLYDKELYEEDKQILMEAFIRDNQ